MTIPLRKSSDPFDREGTGSSRPRKSTSSVVKDSPAADGMNEHTMSIMDSLRNITIDTEIADRDMKYIMPPLYVKKGERLSITISRIQDEPYTQTAQTHTNQKTEVPTMNHINNVKLICMTLNVAITFFFVGAFLFLTLAIFNLVVPRTDSIFGFVLCMIIGFLFTSDKAYRRFTNGS